MYKKPAFPLYQTLISIFLLFTLISATNYNVGPSQTYKTLQDVSNLLQPGDSVFVDGNAVYPADVNIDKNGTDDNWIIIQGIKPTNGARPSIRGGTTYGINISADYIVFEGIQVTSSKKGIGVFGDNILIRGCIINDCNHGLVGYGTGTGNVTVEYCEFYGNGVPTGGATQHQIYMATDEHSHPGSIFRLQYCYLHDGVEGDNVKSRSERNEIYYNWIENAGSSGHGLGLFAPDPDDNSNVNISTAREDADVVGNVIIQPRNSCARIGGDLPGFPTNGRYRFVNNTFILTGNRGDAIRTFNTVETLEMYNNVIYATQAASDIRVLNDADGQWVHSPRSVIGSHNWVISGATRIPTSSEWSNTTESSASPFSDASAKNFHPAVGSDLINNGTTITLYPFVKPLFPPTFVPPEGKLIDIGTVKIRHNDGSIDRGAFEFKTSDIISKNVFHKSTGKVSIWPNPFSQHLSLAYYQSRPGDITITIYSGNGQEVQSFVKKSQGAGVCTIQWDGLSSLNKAVKSGVYIITVKSSANSVSKIIMKQN